MNLLLILQEYISSIGYKKRIKLLSQYVNPKSDDVILDIGGNTGKISAAYSQNKCKEVVVLDPKGKYIEYGRSQRSNIKFIEGGAESIPMPDEYFDSVVASFSFHHLTDQDKGIEEMKRVLKPNGKIIIFESNPNTGRGKMLKLVESLLHTGARFYSPFELRKKFAVEYDLDIIDIYDISSLGYFLIATKRK
jgi:ubiquinone/menaquinone biosynthesis C-methylase UbiE